MEKWANAKAERHLAAQFIWEATERSGAELRKLSDMKQYQPMGPWVLTKELGFYPTVRKGNHLNSYKEVDGRPALVVQVKL